LSSGHISGLRKRATFQVGDERHAERAQARLRQKANHVAHVAAVPITVIRDFEVGARAPFRQADLDAMRQALGATGVEFINEVGVTLRRGAK
jgi:hypothetical protein